jgi:hypothetical protein
MKRRDTWWRSDIERRRLNILSDAYFILPFSTRGVTKKRNNFGIRMYIHNIPVILVLGL